jgi:uncharacterized protein (DUF1501 family)
MSSPTRRGFLMGCSAAIASLAGARFTNIAFAAPWTTPDHDILVTLFLRGGMDGINFVLPTFGPDRAFYEGARTALRVPASGTNAALPLGSFGGNDFGLHPGAAALHELFQDGRVAFVHACGMNTDSRSHFDTQAQIELGTPGVGSTANGWLTRHFLSAGLPPGIVMPSLAVASTIQTSFQGSLEVVAMTNRDDFLLNTGPSDWRDEQKAALRNILESNGADPLYTKGIEALDASTLVELNVPSAGSYVPANGAVYPSGSFGDSLKLIAQMIKLGLGLRAVTLDLGGWDTHNGQGSAGAGTYFHNLVAQLSSGLAAFYLDLDGAGSENYSSKLTVAVMSEFGRRLRENTDSGSDHGHGSVMTVLGGRINGGLYGAWPGLANGQLYDGADLAVTTDYRTVLAELLVERLGNPDVATVFPGFAYPGPLGLATLFRDGYESGGTLRWSARVG